MHILKSTMTELVPPLDRVRRGGGHAQLTGRRLIMTILSVLLAAGPALAQSGSIDHSPTEIVKHYVGLDQKGARLDAMGFDTLAPYIHWQQEPAWGRVVVIQESMVAEDYRQWEVIDKLDVVIPVTFRVLGAVYFDTAVFVPEESLEEVRFHVKAVGGKWRIVEPMIPPHIGLKRMMNFVRDAALHEQDAAKRRTLAALEASLRKAK